MYLKSIADVHLRGLDEQEYLAEAYAGIGLDERPMAAFLGELEKTLDGLGVIGADQSLLDMGCGRGYFLEHLRRRGYADLFGVDPSAGLVSAALFDGVRAGSFEGNDFPDRSIDTVMVCHTLHHIPDPWPVFAIKEMKRIARKAVVVVEINNTNLPTLLLCALQHKVEINAFRYNRARVVKLLRLAGIEPVYSKDMRCGYQSGDDIFHRIAASSGARPYNIVVGRI
jgi:SAM-dependent methyltransferase